MAKIRLFIRDGQNVGFVKITDRGPCYGFSVHEASEFTVDEAREIVGRFNVHTYFAHIVCSPKEYEQAMKPIPYILVQR